MQNYKLKISFIIVLLTITSCLSFDFKGIVYSSSNVDERFEQSIAWNKANSTKYLKLNSEDYKFIVAGDSHLGTSENFEKMIKEANKSDYCFSTIIGDLTNGFDDDYVYTKKIIDSLSTNQFFLIAGNHDLYFKGWDLFYKYFGSSSYIVEIETNNSKDLLIFLDTGSATLGKSQMEWLKDILETTRKNYRNCMIFSHVNLFRVNGHKTTSTNFLTEELNALMNLFYDNNVDYVFSGHDHQRYTIDFGKTKYITLDALKDVAKNASYLIVENKNGSITYNYVKI